MTARTQIQATLKEKGPGLFGVSFPVMLKRSALQGHPQVKCGVAAPA
jgi:hypothetical protein